MLGLTNRQFDVLILPYMRSSHWLTHTNTVIFETTLCKNNRKVTLSRLIGIWPCFMMTWHDVPQIWRYSIYTNIPNISIKYTLPVLYGKRNFNLWNIDMLYVCTFYIVSQAASCDGPVGFSVQQAIPVVAWPDNESYSHHLVIFVLLHSLREPAQPERKKRILMLFFPCFCMINNFLTCCALRRSQLQQWGKMFASEEMSGVLGEKTETDGSKELGKDIRVPDFAKGSQVSSLRQCSEKSVLWADRGVRPGTDCTCKCRFSNLNKARMS